MAPKPSSAASRIVSRGKIFFSSHSAANGVIASAVNLRAISWIWSWSSVRSNCVITRRSRARPGRQQDWLGGHLRLKQSFELHHLANRRPLQHPLAETGEVRPFVEADHFLRPAGDHEKIGIGQGQILAEQIGAGAELPVDMVELLAEIADDELLHLVARVGVEQEAEALVQFGGDEIHHLEDAVAPERAARRKHFGPARPVAEILQDDGILGQHLAAVELQGGNGALGIYRQIVAAVLQRLGAQIDPLSVMVEADFVENDVRGLRAGAGGIIKLHWDESFSVAVGRGVVRVGIVVTVDELVRRRSAAFVGRKGFHVGASRDVGDRHVLILLLRLLTARRRRSDPGEDQQSDCSAHSILPRHLSASATLVSTAVSLPNPRCQLLNALRHSTRSSAPAANFALAKNQPSRLKPWNASLVTRNP